MTTARSQMAGLAALRSIAEQQAGRPGWRDRRRFRAEVRALTSGCRCGCPRKVHGHYRPGTDCGRCGPAACPGYRRSFKIIFRRHR